MMTICHGWPKGNHVTPSSC